MTENTDSHTLALECEHCGYEWEYGGEMWRATCPRCQKKTITPNSPDYEK